VDFISLPVIAGFMSAGAISIASGQVAPFLGIPSKGSEFLHYWENVIGHIEETKLWDPVLGISCVAFLLILRVRFFFLL
jgi:MFS superfamily sulfate permease-like transporter